jgi:hypothetical protein
MRFLKRKIQHLRPLNALYKICEILCDSNDALEGGSCNNLDADFGSWILDAGFCIIALHRLDSTSAECDDLVVMA